MREPSSEEEDRLLEEEVLLLEMVEWGLLKEREWSKEDTAMDARVLHSVGEREREREREREKEHYYINNVLSVSERVKPRKKWIHIQYKTKCT